MPQLNPEFFVTQLFWLVVTFSFLLVFLWRISLPRIGNVLEKRERKISEDLTTAKELQNEAEKIQETIESQLKQARTDASEMIKTSSLTLQDKAQIELTKLDKELDAKIEQSSATIEKSKNESVSQIQNQINEITKLTLSKVAAFDVSDDEIKSAVKRNKVKRRLRNIMNDLVKKISINFNFSYLIIAKTSMLNNEYQVIKDTLFQDFKKIK